MDNVNKASVHVYSMTYG